MATIFSNRTMIRQVVIDNMETDEVRLLVFKIQEAVNEGYQVEESMLEEYVSEILYARDGEVEE